MENSKELLLYDADTAQEYRVVVNNEDHLRAIKDYHFANSLLFHVKINANAKNRRCVVENTQDINDGNYVADTSDVDDNFTDMTQSNILNDNTNFYNVDGLSESNENEAESSSSKFVYTWAYDQTVQLIRSMGTHMDEFNHPKKRKNVYEHVANDVISCGFKVNAFMVQNKWKSLIKSYKKAKNNKTRTGCGPSKFMFYDEMDNILGTTNSCSHSLNSNTFEDADHLISTKDNTQEALICDSENESGISNCIREASGEKAERKIPKRLSEKQLKQNYYMAKAEEYKRRQMRYEERMKVEEEVLEIEKKKIKLLEDYLKIKQK